jgi:hypothetical protein
LGRGAFPVADAADVPQGATGEERRQARPEDEGQPAEETLPETGELREVVKYASAHDCRRSFGTRWAYRVLPQVLQQLMRHERIETTLAYYVELEATRTADAVWEAWESASAGNPGNTLGNTTPAAG